MKEARPDCADAREGSPGGHMQAGAHPSETGEVDVPAPAGDDRGIGNNSSCVRLESSESTPGAVGTSR